MEERDIILVNYQKKKANRYQNNKKTTQNSQITLSNFCHNNYTFIDDYIILGFRK